MGRDTSDAFPAVDATPVELRRALLQIAAEIRRFGVGQQADRLEAIEAMLKPPPLEGTLASLNDPRAFVTPERARWMARCLLDAAGIIEALIADAEITGSDKTIALANAWFSEVGLVRK